ncbi:hypothetical protein MSSIH_2377 [Methanosarcina siciliae HI350]|uniref:Glycosyltransferase RgtA/B/C/D-like domain-containing protein n=1 Tax=Methanosarcina siciliae HI350 TaxID=1434119 RepID=A0A0E3PFP4_9EURY|nr:hypothetical protein MSSIH_2377 [Methanosarcina siciliae HI350]
MFHRSMSNKIMYLLYVQLTVILIIFLLSQRFNIHLPICVFWVSVVAITCIICIQITSFNRNSNKYMILFQIIVFSWIIRTIFIPNTGFFGHDPYKEMEVVSVILNNGWDLDSDIFSNYKYQYSYPILYELIIMGSQVLGTSLFSVARWFPLLYNTSSLLFIYLFSNHLFNSDKSSLLSVFGASMLYQSVMFHTLPIRESIAFVFFVAFLYVYFREKKPNVLFTILALLLIVMITLSHHLTSFLIFLFVFLHILVNSVCKILETIAPRKLYFIPDSRGFNILAYILVLVIGYWIYLRYSPLNIIAYAFEESAYLDPGHGMIVPNNLKFIVLVNGEYFFAFAFAFFSIYSITLCNNRMRINLTLIFWAALMGIMSILSLKGMVLRTESVAFASRFQSFGYISLFVLSGSIIDLKNQKGRMFNEINATVILLYFLFILFSIYRIPVELYT